MSEYHSFYIPVMGTGFTIDTPLKIARYGISSVISLVDDVLIEQMRKFWCEKKHEPYEAIPQTDKDHRVKRISAYLNLLMKMVTDQVANLKKTQFEKYSEITKYFEMLPNNLLKSKYLSMLKETDLNVKKQLQDELREAVVPGSIDVNIMTKLVAVHNEDADEGKPSVASEDAATALRGYANSDLNSTIVFSAGFNPRLYSYIATFSDFFPDDNNEIKKKVCLKVSDYRSAAVQGKYLAKHGIWVSEYRVESALNCGGHAFVNDGQLMGPILEEFKQRKDELIETLFGIYQNALANIKKYCNNLHKVPKVKITAQGGVGTTDEHEFLLNYYGLDAVGWGTPFLLVPEVVNVDNNNLQKLLNATENDIYLSASSPLGIPFWNMYTSASEDARRMNIENGTPGAICVKGYAKFDTELTKKPICQASREYQKLKLQALDNAKLEPKRLKALQKLVLEKSCICHNLAAGATINAGIDPNATGAICPGPNIVNFKKILSLKEMVDHIYGRCSVLVNSEKRPHLFIRELQLQIEYLVEEIKKVADGLPVRSAQKLAEVKENLAQGISYYQKLAKEILKDQQEKFLSSLQNLKSILDNIQLPNSICDGDL